MKNQILAIFSTVLIVLSLLALVSLTNAEVAPPDFPACAEQDGPGDYTHYDYGVHQIVGRGLVEGADDVYSLENGNFLQCFCSVSDEGVQTIWWEVGHLDQATIDEFLAKGGWYLENGVQWNLVDTLYLAKNVEYLCGEPTPTPTPSPTTTPSPSPTPTPHDEPESRCSSLSASPTEGTAPLTVKFNGSGFDEIGDIKKYKFDFGDSSEDQPQIWEQDESEAYHRYENEGEFFAALHIQDSRGNWRNGNEDCKVKIIVTDKPKVLGAAVAKVLPKTGTPEVFGLGLLSMASLGAYLYKRFKLA